MSFFDFGFGFGAGASTSEGPTEPPAQPLAEDDSVEFNPGGLSDAQYMETASNFPSGLSAGFTVGIWSKRAATSSNTAFYSISGDEDHAPSGAGSEDGERFLIYTYDDDPGTSGAGHRIESWQTTYFGDTPPTVDNWQHDSVIGEMKPITEWNLFVFSVDIAAQEAKLYRQLANGQPFQLAATRNPMDITALSASIAPMMFGAIRRGPLPRLFGGAYAELFTQFNVHSAFVYDGALEDGDVFKHWNPQADVDASADPTDPLTITLDTAGVELYAAWTFATADLDAATPTVADRSGNSRDLEAKTLAVSWSEASNRGVSDAP